MSLESPRMVTAANHWTAFPTAVFAGSGIVEQQLHPIKSQQQQRKAMKRLPLMPKASGLMSGGSTHPHKRQIFPRNRGKVGTAMMMSSVAVAGNPAIANNYECNNRNYHDTCLITKDTSTFHSCTNALGGGGANTNTSTATTDLNLLKLAAASQQQPKQQQQQPSVRMPLASVMLPEMTLEANSSNAAAEQGATRARRSRAIAIKRPNASTNAHSTSSIGDKDDGEQPVSASAERMYDWATWRMYERITEHRRRHPIKRSYTHEVSNSSARNNGSAYYDHDEDETEADFEARDQVNDKGLCTIGTRRSLMTPVNGVGQEHFFDGEVFELEI